MRSDYEIGPTTARDKVEVERVLKASYEIAFREAYDRKLVEALLPMVTRASPRLLDSGRYFLVRARDCVVGVGGWSHEYPGKDRCEAGLAHLRHFAVVPEWFGKGVGSLICRTSINRAIGEGVEEMEVYSSLNAEKFYASQGFEKIGNFEVAMSDGRLFPSIQMRRKIHL